MDELRARRAQPLGADATCLLVVLPNGRVVRRLVVLAPRRAHRAVPAVLHPFFVCVLSGNTSFIFYTLLKN